MVEIADRDYKTVAINIFRHLKGGNEHNEGIIRNSQHRNGNSKKTVSHMSNWSLKRKEKEWGQTIFEDIMVEKFPNLIESIKSPIQETQ